MVVVVVRGRRGEGVGCWVEERMSLVGDVLWGCRKERERMGRPMNYKV